MERCSEDNGIVWLGGGIDVSAGVCERGEDVVAAFTLGFGDGGDGGVEEFGGVGDGYHVVEDLPVAAVDLHGAFDGHTDHGFEAVDYVEVLAVVYSGAGLDDVCGEEGADLTN